jgi:Leucine-rich repeat (LRR) protein
MSQLQALQKLDVGGNQLQYSDVEFIIKSFPQLIDLGIHNLGLTGRFSHFAKVAPVLRLNRCFMLSELPESIGDLSSLEKLNLYGNKELKAMPSTIGSLSKLKELLLPLSKLSGRIYL